MASLHLFGPPMYLAFGFKFSPLWAIHPNHRSANAIFVGCSDSAGINPKGGRSCVFRVCLVRGTCYMCLSTHLGRFVSESGNLQFAAYLGGYIGVNKLFGFSHGNEVRQLEFKSKAFELQSPEMEEIYDFRSGPLPGDLAEIEAFCRIQRLADQLHAVVMDSLCSMSSPNASVENAAISVQTSLSERYVPMSSLEDKLVSELACIGTTLQQGRQEIFAAWDSTIVSAPAAPTPRLAHFRSKMRKCCDSFQNAVQCLLPVSRNRAVYESLQRLKTICLDAGYPRPEGAPRHEDIPNFAVVTRQQSALGKKDDIPYFWTGGQFTKQGLVWLLQNKLEIIVDLREEDVNDVLLDSALNKAVSSGKLRLIKLPIKIGTPPSVEQVREFTKIVAENKGKTLYLHCQAGVRRTSTMISKWRDFVSRTDMTVTGQESAMTVFESVDKFPAHNNELPDNNSFSVNEDVQEDAKDASFSCNDLAKIKDTTKPFDAQRPGPNVFSRKHMSQFFQRRKTIPASFSKGLKWRSMTYKTPVQSNIAGPAGRWLPVAGVQGSIVSNLNSQLNENLKPIEVDKDLKKDNIENFGSKFEVPTSAISVSKSASNQLDEETKTLINNNGAAREPENEKHFASDNDVEGDMCTSRTGVVRLQSRKKAEMYLVRTDGFTCTREKVTESTLAFTHPSTQQQMLMWKTAPKTALLLKKLGDELTEEAKMVALFLHHKENINVMVEPEVHDRFARFPGFGFVQTFYNQDRSELHERVDFVVCLGGDGVILHASNLFRSAVPPVVSFNLGSLGFLTAHPFEDFKHDLHAIIHGNQHIEGIYITLRMRLRCEIFRNGMAIPGKVFEVLNEVVVDRGSNPYLCKIECYERNRLITKVQADGVLVATPTGSTAYSTAAGGSMVHPNVPCMLFTPICPHSLSFRPVILPDSALLELKVPNDSRSSAWVSFDGKKRQQLMKGDSIHIHMSGHPMPTVNRSDQTSDWFCSLVPEDARSSAFVSFDGKKKQPIKKGDSIRICMSEHPMPTVNKRDQTDDWFASLSRCFGWNQRIEQGTL